MQDGDFTYTSDGTTVTITGYTGSDAVLAIPSTLAALPVTSIGDEAFSFYISLTSVTLPAGITNIGHSAFYGCTSLASITLPNSVTRIGDSALYGCSSLPDVTIPQSVTTLGQAAFHRCPSLAAINVAADNLSYASVDGLLFDKNQATLIQCPALKSGSYGIPSSVTRIDDSAFYGCTSLTNIVIPNSVTGFGEWAFYGCSSLSAVTISSSVTGISNNAFTDCSSLASVTIPPGVTSIGSSTFSHCTSLTNVTLQTGLTNIGTWAFSDCSSLIRAVIPAGVRYIGDKALRECSSLQRVYFTGDAPSHGPSVFYLSDSVTVYYLSGNTGWGATYSDRPVVLWNPLFSTVERGGATPSFRVTGTPSIPVAVDASTDLLAGQWLRLHTTNLIGGSLDFADPVSTNYPARFYRIVGP